MLQGARLSVAAGAAEVSCAKTKTVLHTLRSCAASLHGGHGRLGVGARWRNATTVKPGRRLGSVSGVAFLNKGLGDSSVIDKG